MTRSKALELLPGDKIKDGFGDIYTVEDCPIITNKAYREFTIKIYWIESCRKNFTSISHLGIHSITKI